MNRPSTSEILTPGRIVPSRAVRFLKPRLLQLDASLVVAVAAAGVTSLSAQIILMREMLTVFHGNELVVGALLANWMLLTCLGAYLGRHVHASDSAVLAAVLTLLGVAPFATVFALRLLKNVVFHAGVMVGFVSVLWSSFVLLIPCCVLSGAAFSLVAGFIPSDRRQGSVGVLYGWESVGSAAGGILFGLVLVHFLRSFTCLAFMLALDLAAAFVVLRGRTTQQLIMGGVAAALMAPAILLDADRFTRGRLFPDQQIIMAEDTPYGNFTVTHQPGQDNIYENGVLLASTNDLTSAEESVHYAMTQREKVRAVLLVSGGITGAAREAQKYDLDLLDYVELNPSMMNLAKSLSSSLNGPAVKIHNEDPRVFIREPGPTYDAVLLNVPEPSTIQLNRYYTMEFFRSIKTRLHKQGVLSLALLPAAEYGSEEARRINSTMMNTLKAVFGNVLIVPGQRTYFLSSDGPLDVRIGALVSRRGINTSYVNAYYLDDDEMVRRSALLHANLFADAPLNADFAPVSYVRQVMYWLEYFRDKVWLLTIVSAVLLLIAGLQLRTLNAGIFTGGFAATSVELLLLIAFQILYGHVYQMLGVIMTLFMAGLAAGAFLRPALAPLPTVRGYALIQGLIALFCMLLPFVFMMLHLAADVPVLVHGVIFTLTFFLAVMVGAEFSIASELRKGEANRIASELYGVDLIGSALGALSVAMIIIPAIGVIAASIVPGILSFLSMSVTLLRRKSLASAFV